ncbi:FAD-dependent oxidoreductase [Nonomuraea ferruginea]
MRSDDLPVAVVGAGPVGLAAAAHLAERGLDFVVLEAGEQAGASVAQWGHVRVFSPWKYNIDPAARRLLEADGWSAPDPEWLPTGTELIDDYLAPLAKLFGDRIRTGAKVSAISRLGYDRVRAAGRERAPFLIRLAERRRAARPRGRRRLRHLRHPERARRVRPARPRRGRRGGPGRPRAA